MNVRQASSSVKQDMCVSTLWVATRVSVLKDSRVQNVQQVSTGLNAVLTTV